MVDRFVQRFFFSLMIGEFDLLFVLQVYKARRVANMKMVDDGFQEKAEARKAQKLKTLAEKGLLKKRKR